MSDVERNEERGKQVKKENGRNRQRAFGKVVKALGTPYILRSNSPLWIGGGDHDNVGGLVRGVQPFALIEKT